MTLLHLFLIHRYHAASVHFLTPTEDNRRQCDGMREMGIFAGISDEVGEIIVADVDAVAVRELAAPDSERREGLITGGSAVG